MSDDGYRHMLRDIVVELASIAKKATAVRGDDFAMGRSMGLYEAVSLIERQAVAFGIDPAGIGFGDFTAEDLLAPPT